MSDGRKNNGGKRPGAGRKKAESTIMYEALKKKVEEHADEIAEILWNKAKEGELQALRELLDRVMGKPPQSTDLTSNGEKIPGIPLLPKNIKTDNDEVQPDNSNGKDS